MPTKTKTPATKRKDYGASAETYFAKLDGELAKITTTLAAIVKSAAPKSTVAIKWGMPVWTTEDGMLCYVRAQKSYVRFGFTHDAKLADPDGVLEGSAGGKHVKLASVKAIDKKQIAGWVKQSAKFLADNA